MTAEQESATDRKIPFPASEASEGFTRSLAESTQALVDQNTTRFIPPFAGVPWALTATE